MNVVVEDKEPQGMEKLRRLEARIHDGDQKGNRARWESGKELRALREAEPHLTLEDIAGELGVSAAELGFRIKFSSLPEEQLTHVMSKSWFEVRNELPALVGRERAKRKHQKRPVIVKEITLMLRRLKTNLRKVHAVDLTEADWKVLDVLQEDIARIYDEAAAEGEKK